LIAMYATGPNWTSVATAEGGWPLMTLSGPWLIWIKSSPRHSLSNESPRIGLAVSVKPPWFSPTPALSTENIGSGPECRVAS